MVVELHLKWATRFAFRHHNHHGTNDDLRPHPRSKDQRLGQVFFDFEDRRWASRGVLGRFLEEPFHLQSSAPKDEEPRHL